MRVPVLSDNIVEGDEMFIMRLNVPSSLGPGIVAGSVTSATGIILDSTGKKYNCQKDRSYCHIDHRYQGEVHKTTICWFRRYKICTGNIGTNWRNIQ